MEINKREWNPIPTLFYHYLSDFRILFGIWIPYSLTHTSDTLLGVPKRHNIQKTIFEFVTNHIRSFDSCSKIPKTLQGKVATHI
jgi:hypothetical protein